MQHHIESNNEIGNEITAIPNVISEAESIIVTRTLKKLGNRKKALQNRIKQTETQEDNLWIHSGRLDSTDSLERFAKLRLHGAMGGLLFGQARVNKVVTYNRIKSINSKTISVESFYYDEDKKPIFYNDEIDIMPFKEDEFEINAFQAGRVIKIIISKRKGERCYKYELIENLREEQGIDQVFDERTEELWKNFPFKDRRR